jgi:hypothetical protein
MAAPTAHQRLAICWCSTHQAQNGYAGHVAVVNWVAGDTLEYVQQNVCPTGPPEPYGWANLEVELDNGKQLFSITDGGSGGSVAGWVHSDLIKQQLIDQPEMRRAGDIRWNRDDTAVYVYLSPARTRAAARKGAEFIDQDVALLEFADLLKEALARLSFTTYDLAWQIANQVGEMDSQRPPLEPGQRRAVGGFHAQVHRPDDLGAAVGWAGQWEVDTVCDGRSGVCLCTCMEDAESRTTRVMTLTLG